MKWCTRIALDDNGLFKDVIDISMVGDDHVFGVTEDGTELHHEARVKTVDNDDTGV